MDRLILKTLLVDWSVQVMEKHIPEKQMDTTIVRFILV